MNIRSTVRRAIERITVTAGVPRRALRRLSGKTLVLAYHNIVPSGERPIGDQSLHLMQRDFARQLDLLAEMVEVVGLDEIFSGSPEETEPRVAITFDDAYQGALTAGLEELRTRGFQATIFVAPGCLGRTFWWDRLAASHGGGLPAETRDRALDRFRGREALIDEGLGRGADELPLHCHAVTESELQSAARIPGITLGSHSMTHPNLARADAKELVAELTDSRAWLAARFSVARPWIAYPYGRASEAVFEAGERLGYERGLLGAGGWFSALSTPSLSVPRLDVPAGVTADGFAARIAGLWG